MGAIFQHLWTWKTWKSKLKLSQPSLPVRLVPSWPGSSLCFELVEQAWKIRSQIWRCTLSFLRSASATNGTALLRSLPAQPEFGNTGRSYRCRTWVAYYAYEWCLSTLHSKNLENETQPPRPAQTSSGSLDLLVSKKKFIVHESKIRCKSINSRMRTDKLPIDNWSKL